MSLYFLKSKIMKSQKDIENTNYVCIFQDNHKLNISLTLLNHFQFVL